MSLAVRHKVFVAYYEGDRPEVDAFVERWATREGVFIPKVLGISSGDDFVDSNNPEYVMDQIRQKYLGDSTVTIVLIGPCTHSRRYIDWGIKSSCVKAMCIRRTACSGSSFRAPVIGPTCLNGLLRTGPQARQPATPVIVMRRLRPLIFGRGSKMLMRRVRTARGRSIIPLT